VLATISLPAGAITVENLPSGNRQTGCPSPMRNANRSPWFEPADRPRSATYTYGPITVAELIVVPGDRCRQSVAPVRALNATMVPSHDVGAASPTPTKSSRLPTTSCTAWPSDARPEPADQPHPPQHQAPPDSQPDTTPTPARAGVSMDPTTETPTPSYVQTTPCSDRVSANRPVAHKQLR
jgi:hypothetical protein